MLTESVDSTVLPLLFSSPTTATMAFFTSVDILCLYPSLIVNNIVLSGFNTVNDTPVSLTNRGLRVMTTMQERGLECTDETCLSVMRSWDGKRLNIGKFKWNMTRQTSEWDTYMRNTIYHWRRRVYVDTKSCTCKKFISQSYNT